MTGGAPVEDGPVELDCRGQRCPLPVINVAGRAAALPPGTVLRVRTDDPAAGPDLAAWCRMRGQEFRGGTDLGDHQVYEIRTAAAPPS